MAPIRLLGLLKRNLVIHSLLLILINFQNCTSLQHDVYFISAICQNKTVEIHGDICETNAMVPNKYCISFEKFKSIVSKLSDCQVSVKSSNSRNLNSSELTPDYSNFHKRIWRRQLDFDNCNSISPPKPGKVNCRILWREISCIGICNNGYRFVDGAVRKTHKCFDNGLWIPSPTFPPCQAQCNPICQNGGKCTDINTCSCPKKFRGELCQYPLTLCGISKTSSASSWQCNHTNAGSKCKVSCYPPGSIEAENNYYIHSCSIHGIWNPLLPPCVVSQTILNAVCLDPGIISNGYRNVSFLENEWFKVGTVLSYFCDKDTEMTKPFIMKCEINGRWSGKVPKCPSQEENRSTSKTSCSDVGYLKNIETRMIFPNTYAMGTHVVFNGGSHEESNTQSGIKSFPVGTKIHFKCKSRYYKLYGSEYQTCQSSGTWSGNKPICLPNCGKSEIPRQPLIVGGKQSEAGMWPWQVGLSIYHINTKYDRNMGSVACGGSLISEKYVVTAAHCVTSERSKAPLSNRAIIAYFGKHYRDASLDDEHVQTRMVRRIIINEDYDFVKFEADIALLELEKPVELTTRVQPICLPTETTAAHNLRPGKLGVVTGWGLTEDGAFSKELHETVLSVISKEECEESYHRGLRSITVSERMICAGGNSSDTCSGDSGGPFAFLDAESCRTWVLEGIISWGSGVGCGRTKEYSGFTKVVRFVDWIKTFL